MKEHSYKVQINWTGNLGKGTKSYQAYSRDHTLLADGKQSVPLSADPSFLGNENNYNPEELLLSSIASCHMLWYLHLCATNNIIVLEYSDFPEGIMVENKNGSGKFSQVTLHPKILIQQETNVELAIQLHQEANKMCFIANSCNFPIDHSPSILFSKSS